MAIDMISDHLKCLLGRDISNSFSKNAYNFKESFFMVSKRIYLISCISIKITITILKSSEPYIDSTDHELN